MSHRSPVFAVIDLGSSSISGMVARKDAAGRIFPLGYAEEPSKKSVLRGTIHNIAGAAEIISSIIEQLNGFLEENYHIERVYVGVDCMTLRSHNEVFTFEMDEESTPITEEMLDELQGKVGEKQYEGREVIYIAEPFFRIDSIHTTKPIGVVCRDKFEAHYRLISIRSSIARNIRLVIEEHLQLSLVQILVSPLCESNVLLTPTQKELGCAYVNIGGGTTSVSLFAQGSLELLCVYPFGGSNVTRDLTDLNVVESDAERIKIEYSSAVRSSEDRNETVQIEREGDGKMMTLRMIDVNNLSSMRMKEILANVVAIAGYSEIPKEQLRAGYIFAGGGTKIRKMNELIELFCTSNYTINKTVRNDLLSDEMAGMLYDYDYFSDTRYTTVLGLIAEAKENCVEVTHKTLTELVENTRDKESEKPSEEMLSENAPSEKYSSEEEGMRETLFSEEDYDDEEENEGASTKEQGGNTSKKGSKFNLGNFMKRATTSIGNALLPPEDNGEEKPYDDF